MIVACPVCDRTATSFTVVLDLAMCDECAETYDASGPATAFLLIQESVLQLDNAMDLVDEYVAEATHQGEMPVTFDALLADFLVYATVLDDVPERVLAATVTPPCPKCQGTTHRCQTGECIHCDTCDHTWLPKETDMNADPRTSPPTLNVEEFATILMDEFNRDDWGRIDPDLFRQVALGELAQENDVRDAEGLHAVLTRVIARLAPYLAALAVVLFVGCTTGTPTPPQDDASIRDAIDLAAQTWCETRALPECSAPPLVLDQCITAIEDSYCSNHDCSLPYEQWPALEACVDNAVNNPLCDRARCAL